jgi:hypothetical protein
MTYRERYLQTTGWIARHLAKDLMEMNGANEIVSVHDEALIIAAEKREAK